MFLTATPGTITPGQDVTLAWQTRNATSITIDNGVGSVTPVAGGSVVVNPTQTTTYTATVTGASSSVNCKARVVVETTPPPPPSAECVFLTADPTSVRSGEAVTLSWQTRNATSISIDNGVGSVTPVAAGSVTVNPTETTTYTATVTGATGSVNCQARVVVESNPPPPGPQCVSLVADRTSIQEGESVTLTWETRRATTVNISNIGDVTPVDGGSRTVTPSGDTTYVATVNGNITNDNCRVSISVGEDDDDDDGGGGGGRKRVRVSIDSLEQPGEQPLSFVYLSEVPHTGLELGPVGTAVYWFTLVAGSALAAWFLLFKGLPFVFAGTRTFGSQVRDVLNQETYTTHEPGHAAMPSAHGAHQPASAPAHGTGFRQEEGFRSFAGEGALTIDDIVNGLARMESVDEAASYQWREQAPEPYTPALNVEPIGAPVPAKAPEASVELMDDVPGFIAALLRGDRDEAFGTIRRVTRAGGDSEEFLTHTVCALDDAYRARIDGTTCHPEIARLTSDCGTPFLEKLVTALTTAVDGSYSAGVTGVKLAVTRALAHVNG